MDLWYVSLSERAIIRAVIIAYSPIYGGLSMNLTWDAKIFGLPLYQLS